MTQPLLPTADKLLLYLERIDKSRFYSNFGCLNEDYQDRLAGMFGAPCVTGSSATSLLTATLMAFDLPKNSFVAMPSWTFPATAAAVVSAGLVPYFCDVSEDGVLMVGECPCYVSAIILVAPFGVSLRDYLPVGDALRLDIPVIIDAAAGFDAFSTVCKPGNAPVVVSTHATKAFGTGEGGFVTCHDKPLLERIRRITNFGFTPDRRIEYSGLNAKFSEYHAAVGLAELDGWSAKRLKLLAALEPYGIDYAITQVCVPVSKYPDARMNVYGCHIHDAYKDYPRTKLPVTEELIRTIGVKIIGVE